MDIVHCATDGSMARCQEAADSISGARWTRPKQSTEDAGSEIVRLHRPISWWQQGADLLPGDIEIREPFELAYPYHATNWYTNKTLLITRDYPPSLEFKWCVSRDRLQYHRISHVRSFKQVLLEIKDRATLAP
jgi:hypothetical protein